MDYLSRQYKRNYSAFNNLLHIFISCLLFAFVLCSPVPTSIREKAHLFTLFPQMYRQGKSLDDSNERMPTLELYDCAGYYTLMH